MDYFPKNVLFSRCMAILREGKPAWPGSAYDSRSGLACPATSPWQIFRIQKQFMKVYNLCCPLKHQFEGWFGSEADFLAQQERKLIACPLCASDAITRLPSAPRLNLKGYAGDPAPAPEAPASAPEHAAPEPELLQAQAHLLNLVREVISKTEDVGQDFADEARRIHYNEAPERPIRGQASAEQRAELAEEGIEVLALPMPALLKETLQ
jgi:hypothetical protein